MFHKFLSCLCICCCCYWFFFFQRNPNKLVLIYVFSDLIRNVQYSMILIFVILISQSSRKHNFYIPLPLLVRCLCCPIFAKRTASSLKETGNQPLPSLLVFLVLPYLLWTQSLLFPPWRHHDRRDLVTQDFRECRDGRLSLGSSENMAGETKKKKSQKRKNFFLFIQLTLSPFQPEHVPQRVNWRTASTRSTVHPSLFTVPTKNKSGLQKKLYITLCASLSLKDSRLLSHYSGTLV